MGVHKSIGENDVIDSGDGIEDVSYIPNEIEVVTSEEKSDAQLIADGEISTDEGDIEIFVDPNSVHTAPEKEEVKEEKIKEEGEKVEEKQEVKPAKEEEVKKKASAPDAVQKRINKITREKYEAQRKNEKLEKELAKFKGKAKEAEFAAKKADLKASKPKLEDFEEDGDYYEALGRWSAKDEIMEHESAKEEESTSEEESVDPVQQIINVGKETYPDFEDLVLREDLKITPAMVDAAADSEYASDIFYHLGQHPELATKIAGMRSPTQVTREIGRIEDKFIAEEVPEVYAQTPEDDSETVVEPKDKKRKVSKAPPPVKPLSGGGKTAQSLEEMSIAEYQEARGYTRQGMKKPSTI